MTIAYAAGATANDATGTAVTTSLGTTVAGQLIVITVADDSATTTAITGVSDNHGNTWTKVPLARTNNVVQNSVAVQMWYSVLTTGGAGHTVTVTWSLTNTARVTVAAQYFNGFVGTPTYDQNHSATGSTTSANAGALTTAQTSLLVTGAGHAGTTSAFTATAPMTNLDTANAANASVGQANAVLAAGTNSGILTIAAARAWGAAVASFYDAGGTGTITPAAVASAETFGTPAVVRLLQQVTPAAVASAETFGTASVSNRLQLVSPASIDPDSAVGTPTVFRPSATVVLPPFTVPVRSLTTDEILTGNRTTRFRYDLLTRDEAPKGILTGVDKGSVDWTANASVKGGGSLEVVDLGQDVDWLNDRVRPVVLVEGLPEQPLGVFLASEAPEDWSDTGRTWSVKLLDKTSILDTWEIDQTLTLSAGTVLTDFIVSIITGIAGEANVSITPSTATAPGDILWLPGTEGVTLLAIVNDVLAMLNYFSLYCDETGQFRGDPYMRPAARPIDWEFMDDERSIYDPKFKRDVDLYGIPNEVIAVSQSDGITPALVSTAINDDPTSPYSTVSRGKPGSPRFITHTERGVEAASQAILDAYALRRLIELTSPTSGIDVMHAYVPGLTFNHAVRFRRVPAGIDARHVVSKTAITLDGTALVKSTFTEVIDL